MKTQKQKHLPIAQRQRVAIESAVRNPSDPRSSPTDRRCGKSPPTADGCTAYERLEQGMSHGPSGTHHRHCPRGGLCGLCQAPVAPLCPVDCAFDMDYDDEDVHITGLSFRGFQQFKRLDLDFTDPATGKPLNRVCFIGPNGTGKSTLMRLLRSMLGDEASSNGRAGGYKIRPSWTARITNTGGESCRVVVDMTPSAPLHLWLDERATQLPEWSQFLEGNAPVFTGEPRFHPLLRPFIGLTPGEDLVVYVPSDEALILSTDPPNSTLNDAQHMIRRIPVVHALAPSTANTFWSVLIALIAKRVEDYHVFLRLDSNRTRIVGEVEAEFESQYPEILPKLAQLWNRLLAPAGLELDLEGVRLPSQLSHTLGATVRVKASKTPLPYNQLSSGMRSFLFRLGYLYALYFGRDVRRGFLFVDEPENSLHPDFLYNLVDEYSIMIKNTQLFVATHSPIIAGQFRPEERVLLGFDESGHVVAERGQAAVGTDPNHVLMSDFHVRSIYGRQGLEKWNRFKELRELILSEDDKAKKKALCDEYMAIGRDYRFDPDEISR